MLHTLSEYNDACVANMDVIIDSGYRRVNLNTQSKRPTRASYNNLMLNTLQLMICSS